MKLQTRSQPSDKGGRFNQILDLFQGFKIGVPSGCLEEPSIFKITNLVAIWFE